MEPVTAAIITSITAVVVAILTSSGIWAYFQRRDSLKGAHTQLLLGLAHDRIIDLGMVYIEQGWISKDEYEDYIHYLCSPYSKFGGNGLAEKVMNDVKMLPVRNSPKIARLSTGPIRIVREENSE